MRKFRGTFLIITWRYIMRWKARSSPDILHLMITATKQTRPEDGKVVVKPMMPLIAKYDAYDRRCAGGEVPHRGEGPRTRSTASGRTDLSGNRQRASPLMTFQS